MHFTTIPPRMATQLAAWLGFDLLLIWRVDSQPRAANVTLDYLTHDGFAVIDSPHAAPIWIPFDGSCVIDQQRRVLSAGDWSTKK